MLAPNSTLQQGRYRVIRHLNSGGMGAVYETFDNRLQRKQTLPLWAAIIAAVLLFGYLVGTYMASDNSNQPADAPSPTEVIAIAPPATETPPPTETATPAPTYTSTPPPTETATPILTATATPSFPLLAGTPLPQSISVISD